MRGIFQKHCKMFSEYINNKNNVLKLEVLFMKVLMVCSGGMSSAIVVEAIKKRSRERKF